MSDIHFQIIGYPNIQTVRADVPLYIKDDDTGVLVAELAKRRGISKQDAVKLAVSAELEREAATKPLRERMAAWRMANPVPPPTGEVADKAFFDALCGEP